MSNTESRPTLYLMLGYPGAGKTTTAKVLSELTGAVHVWADHERRTLFGTPTYDQAENDQLYSALNQEAIDTLRGGTSVVFDTGFNERADRDHLRTLAQNVGASSLILWVSVPSELARERATADAHLQHSRALGDMSNADFERLKAKLEPPAPDEPYVQLDGTRISAEYLSEKLRLR